MQQADPFGGLGRGAQLEAVGHFEQAHPAAGAVEIFGKLAERLAHRLLLLPGDIRQPLHLEGNVGDEKQAFQNPFQLSCIQESPR